MTDDTVLSKREDGQVERTPWGELNWKISATSMPGAEMTFGTCRIDPGQRNPLHSHPNCEEILYVVSGRCEHKLGDRLVQMQAGDAIRIPRNVRHWARNVGDEPLFAVIFFSSGERRAENHEGAGAA